MDRHSTAACSGDSDCHSRRRGELVNQRQQQFFGGPSLQLQRKAAVFKARRRCNAWLESDLSNDDGDDDEEEDDTVAASPPPRPSAVREKEKKTEPRKSRASKNETACRLIDERPINFMEVYHRLKLGDLSCQPELSKEYYSYYLAKQLLATAGVSESAANLEIATIAAEQMPRLQNTLLDEAGSADNSDLRQLQRLLRERDRISGGTPPPVPKPRKSNAAARCRSTSRHSTLSQPSPPPACSRRRHHLAPHESTCGPFASVAVSTAQPFETPRQCRLLSERIASKALDPQQAVSYHSTDWELLRRLSITGRLSVRDRGRAPTRWLSSAALLTHLNYPTCREIAPKMSSSARLTSTSSPIEPAPPAVATETLVHWPPPNEPAKPVDSPLIGFAFKAMDRRRLRSRSGEAAQRRRRRKSMSNLYAVPVS